MLNSSKAASISFTIPSGPVALFLFSLISANFASHFNIFLSFIYLCIAGRFLSTGKRSQMHSLHLCAFVSFYKNQRHSLDFMHPVDKHKLSS